MRLFIPYDFPNWNKYIAVERGNRYMANKIKQEEKQFVCFACWTARERYQGNYPVTLTIRPYFKDKRKDLDNFRMKGLIDGLVAAGVIKNDNLTCIDRIILEPIFSDKEGVEVEITETR